MARTRSSAKAEPKYTPTAAPEMGYAANGGYAYSNNNPYSLQSVMTAISNNFAILLLAGLCFLGGFFLGSVWTENQILRSGKYAGAAPTAGVPTNGAPPAGAPSGPTEDQLKNAPEVSNDDHIRGNRNAKVVLVEYSDFECPFCARFHPTMTQVMEEYGDQVAWVYRHYPLSFHPNAQKAAEASECVAKQQGDEGFWKFVDSIFEENNKAGGQISPAVIESVAQSTGVNMTSFKSCLDSGEMAQKVSDHMTGGSGAGISGTPGTIIFADGKAELIPGALPFEQVKPMIDRYL
ncbi:MAG TPA: thioredoxin domain-containing protein [Vitreimonas sp.]|nr:thioredoxin domain-containing protein [Vitreimonas sp.]